MPRNNDSVPSWLKSVPGYSGTYPYDKDPNDPYRYEARITSVQEDESGALMPKTIAIHVLNSPLGTFFHKDNPVMTVSQDGSASVDGTPLKPNEQADFLKGLPKMKALLAKAEAKYNEELGINVARNESKTKEKHVTSPKDVNDAGVVSKATEANDPAASEKKANAATDKTKTKKVKKALDPDSNAPSVKTEATASDQSLRHGNGEGHASKQATTLQKRSDHRSVFAVGPTQCIANGKVMEVLESYMPSGRSGMIFSRELVTPEELARRSGMIFSRESVTPEELARRTGCDNLQDSRVNLGRHTEKQSHIDRGPAR